MFSSDDINTLLKDTLDQMNLDNTEKTQGTRPSPSGLLVVAGILGGVLEVNLILVDVEQTVQIVVTGSLKNQSLQSESLSIEDFISSFLANQKGT